MVFRRFRGADGGHCRGSFYACPAEALSLLREHDCKDKAITKRDSVCGRASNGDSAGESTFREGFGTGSKTDEQMVSGLSDLLFGEKSLTLRAFDSDFDSI